MRKPDFRLIPNLHTILVCMALLIVGSSITSSFLPEFILQITTLTETNFDLERESKKELHEFADDENQILPGFDQHFCSAMNSLFHGNSVCFPGWYTFIFTPPPELI